MIMFALVMGLFFISCPILLIYMVTRPYEYKETDPINDFH